MNLEFEVDSFGMAYTYVNGVKGTLNYFDTSNLIKEIQGKEGIYLETGSYLGCSAVMAALVSNVIVYAHDIWSEKVLDDGTTVPPPKPEDDYFKIFYNNVKKNKLQGRVIPIRGDSKYTVNAIHDNETVDIAFVDGDHSEDGIYGDLIAVYPKLKSGGVLLCHDCTRGSVTYDGFVKFANEFELKFEELHGTHGMIKVVKR